MSYQDQKRIVRLKKKNDKLEYKKELNEFNIAYLEETISKDEEKMTARQERKIKKMTERQERRRERLIKKKEAKILHYQMNEPPVLSVLEEVGNSVTHGVGALLAIAGIVLLLLKSDTGWKVTASLVYGCSLFFMMLASCLYHAFKARSKVKRVFRRFDYSSIYLLIGGTFAPLLLIYWPATYHNYWGLVIFIIQWVAIVTGITMVGVFGPGRLKWLHFPLYFVIGWSGVMFIPGWIQNNLTLLWFILGGGIVYTTGMIPFVKRGVPAAHFIWHFFVLAGAIVHFIGIYLCVY